MDHRQFDFKNLSDSADDDIDEQITWQPLQMPVILNPQDP